MADLEYNNENGQIETDQSSDNNGASNSFLEQNYSVTENVSGVTNNDTAQFSEVSPTIVPNNSSEVITSQFPEEKIQGIIDQSNKSGNKKSNKAVIISVIALLAAGNLVLGYFFMDRDKSYKQQKSIVDEKTNCAICPVNNSAEAIKQEAVLTPTPTPIPTPTPTSSAKKSTGSSTKSTSSSSSQTESSQEEVIAPPPPPTD